MYLNVICKTVRCFETSFGSTSGYNLQYVSGKSVNPNLLLDFSTLRILMKCSQYVSMYSFFFQKHNLTIVLPKWDLLWTNRLSFHSHKLHTSDHLIKSVALHLSKCSEQSGTNIIFWWNESYLTSDHWLLNKIDYIHFVYWSVTIYILCLKL